ncbi:hypothetical protein [Enterococcus sp. DIV0187]|uniref:hypothetical protein n=1 Tax=Enterococcus sp. DIV0187 TaxID=2774644 RepID=UPI003F1F75E1
MEKTITVKNEAEYQEFVQLVDRLKAAGHDVDVVDIPAPFGTGFFKDKNVHEIAIVDSEHYRKWTLQDFVDEIEFVNGRPLTSKYVHAAEDESIANIYAYLTGPLNRFGQLMTRIAEQNEHDMTAALLSYLYDIKLFETIDVLKERTYDELFKFDLVEDDSDLDYEEADDSNLYRAVAVGELAVISEYI